MSEDVYRKLQQQLDQYSMGYPATESGIEIKILKYLFSEEDANVFLNMTPKLEAPEAVAQRMGEPEADMAAKLEDMAERGLLFRLKKGGVSKYGTIPFVHGLFEFQVKTLDKELSEMGGIYFDEAFDDAMQFGVEHFLRTIPVQQSLDVAHNVASYEDAVEILKNVPQIVVTDCICRKRASIMEEDCGKALEACFMFGSMGQYYIDRGMGRVVSLEEAVQILEKCREDGLVTQPATAQNPGGMCNCCGDCCGVLRAINKHPKPVEIVFSNHYAVVSDEDCTGCETCLERCQMGAIDMKDDVAQINLDRCIGCGLCVTACPTEAITLAAKSEDAMRLPPASMMEQMMGMAQKRGLM
ncbi:4Fe-4S binding domain-containing protein [Desulfatibacillum alkenivorans DSM 16219]|jgi:Fe-S-cluster-containing hydrogenase component 2|uniref:4Fe-4S binding domain-containing protein n=1 Tax=Desulfatibacillum alkenivorans DSM 16219 TaxID=1121393 RepID=A0A1M6X7F3_9BACT|nr:4Fe-4S dicluster domain-containing protein [Desulfatibacillum alkenivorans]SHL01874.1 4Fe-4S binding domain-containing protein [Desulfatibacillum alkenivorans DSM 16219]